MQRSLWLIAFLLTVGCKEATSTGSAVPQQLPAGDAPTGGATPNDSNDEIRSDSAATARFNGRTIKEWRQRLKRIDPGNPEAAAEVPWLTALVESREVPSETRSQAAQLLGRMGASAAPAIPTLLRIVEDEEESNRLWAAKGLFLLGKVAQPAAPTLLRITRDQDEPLAVRQATLEALGSIGMAHAEVIPALIEMLEKPAGSEHDADVLRAQAAETIAIVGPAASSAIPALIRGLRDGDESLRRNAAIALGAMGARAEIAVPALAEALALDESTLVREAAAAALSQIGSASLPVLMKFLSDENAELRQRAATAIGNLATQGKPAREALMNTASDADGAVRISAMEALWKVDRSADGYLDKLVNELTNEDRQVRIRAIRLFGEMGSAAKDASSLLERLAQDERAWVRQAATAALREIEPQEAGR